MEVAEDIKFFFVFFENFINANEVNKISKLLYGVAAVVVFVAIGAMLLFNVAPTTTGYSVGSENVLGSENAKVTIEEYSDFECPFCGRAEPTIKQILEKYPNDVKLVYKHYPLPSHKSAWKAAEASECAVEQNKFWEYHDVLFANQNELYVPMLKDYAKQVGMNSDTFNRCLDSGMMFGKVKADQEEGAQKGVTGTPAFFVNGKLISGAQPFSVFDAAVGAELAK